MEIDEAVNLLVTKYGIANNQYEGRRVIRGSQAPTAATHGLLGDVYRLKIPLAGKPFEWICTKSGAGSGAGWRALTEVE